MLDPAPTRDSSPALVRAVGWLSLTAIAINGTIGAGIFALPAMATKILGPSSPLAYLAAGAAMLLIVFCFAEAGGRFERSGGPYLYATAAFGPFVGFEVGWVFVLARLTATAAVSNTFADYFGYLWPAVAHGTGRVITLTLLIGGFAAINCLGVRFGARIMNILTAGKLVPLITFCVVGLFFVDSHSFSFTTLPQWSSLQQASLLMLFAMGGFEFASVPSEEVVNPKRTVPAVLVSSVIFVVTLYLWIQVVAMGTLPDLAGSATPLASSAAKFLGPAGGLLMTIGAMLSTTATSAATILVGSRMLLALSQRGQLPSILARIHPGYRTPVVSILFFSFVAWVFAVSGTFAQLALANGLARLLYYTTTCVALPVLRRKQPATARHFTVPGGPVIPVIASAVCGWMLIGTSKQQALMAGAALLAGAALCGLGDRTRASKPASGQADGL